jgi:transcriptional accessory protein Tex/SPT6
MITKQQYEEAKKIVKEYEKQIDKTEHWQDIVDFWFTFYKSKKKFEPTLLPRDTKALKGIVKTLKAKAESTTQIEWDKTYCLRVFEHFLNLAYTDNWLSENFLLPNLYSKIDSIISKNGKPKQQSRKGIDAENAINLLNQFSS